MSNGFDALSHGTTGARATPLASGNPWRRLRGNRHTTVPRRAGGEVAALGKDFLIFLAATVLVVPLSRQLQIIPILGFIAAGILIGPAGLGLLGNSEMDVELGDFGILFLLFSEGLELPFERFSRLAKLAATIGLGQVVLTTV